MNSPSRGASAMASKRGDIRTSSWSGGRKTPFRARTPDRPVEGRGRCTDVPGLDATWARLNRWALKSRARRGRLSLVHMGVMCSGLDSVVAAGCHRSRRRAKRKRDSTACDRFAQGARACDETPQGYCSNSRSCTQPLLVSTITRFSRAGVSWVASALPRSRMLALTWSLAAQSGNPVTL